MLKFILFYIASTFLKPFRTDCVSPVIEGIILEDKNYYEGKIISNEIVLENTKISYMCDKHKRISICNSGEWEPPVNVIKCRKNLCTVPRNLTNLTLIGANEGDVFEQYETVSYVCEEHLDSLSSGNFYGISICENNIFSPPIECFEYEKLCRIPIIDHGLIVGKYKFGNYSSSNYRLNYICEDGYKPKKILKKVGSSKCFNRSFIDEEYPTCIKMCHTSSLKNAKISRVYDFGYVESGKEIVYYCDKDHPISLDDINSEENNMNPGRGTLTCLNGVFSFDEICFSGCLMPKFVKSESKFVENNSHTYYKCNDNDFPKIINCYNNTFDKEINCLNEDKYCELPPHNLKYNHTAISICPREMPISSEDISGNNNPVTGEVKLTCSKRSIECFEGCIIPLSIINEKNFVFSGESIFVYCPIGMVPTTFMSTCYGINFHPFIECVQITPEKCLIPETNFYIKANVKIKMECGFTLKEFICQDNGNWEPIIEIGCFLFCDKMFLKSNVHLAFSHFLIGKIYNYVCQPGEFSKSHGLLYGFTFCTPYGHFYPEPDCSVSLSMCLKPSINNSLSTNIGKYHAALANNDFFVYKCMPGFTPAFGVFKCNNNFQETPSCKQQCRVLKNQYNFNVTKTIVNFNTFTKYSCFSKYYSNDRIGKIGGVLYCLNEGKFETSDWNICNYYCKFPKNAHVIPQKVYMSHYFNYSCPDGRSGNNILCHGIFVPLCIKNSCIIPEVPNAFDYHVFLENRSKLKVFPFELVTNNSKISFFCGTYSKEFICNRHLNFKCSDECQVRKFNGLTNIYPPVGFMLSKGEYALYRCENNSDINFFYCHDQKLVSYHLNNCFADCPLLNLQDYTLAEDIQSEFLPFNGTAKYNCTGGYTGQVIYKCTEDGGKIIGNCNNECVIEKYVFGLKEISASRLVENDSFEFTCSKNLSRIASNYYCFKKDDKWQIWPEIKCYFYDE